MDASPNNPIPALLRAVAEPTLRGTPILGSGDQAIQSAYLDGFADEFRRRHPSHRPLLARVLGIDPGPTPATEVRSIRLLWAMHDRSIDPRASLIEPEKGTPSPLIHNAADDSVAIEWRTLDELTALHALWNTAADRGDRALKERCLDAARWHVDELQPDNATNLPWAIHVFYELSAIGTDHRSMGAPRFHAESMLHNCRVQRGHPDLFSACILMDAARTLGPGPE